MRLTSIIITLLLPLSYTSAQTPAKPVVNMVKTKAKATAAKLFCVKKHYNTQYAILIDMSLPSGVNRFFVWDYKGDSILIKGLVSHGCGDMPWAGVWSKDKPTFSSVNGSHCTALGKYLIGARAYSQWGIHVKYFLSGLEASTQNAMARQIVMHSWSDISAIEVYPGGTPEGWGCPAVADEVMKKVDTLLKLQKRRVLMWIYK